MYNKKKIIAIIPARSGSKGLPGKNIKLLNGKPLIAWSIIPALKSKYIDEVVVTTDSVEIANISKQFGANIPFLRPNYLSDDNISSFDVVEHTIKFYNENFNRLFDYLILLEPTSPLREVSDIDASIEQLIDNKTNALSIVGVCKTECQNPAFLVVKKNNNFISSFMEGEVKVLRRQEIEEVYFFEGSVYVAEIESYLNLKTFYHDKTIAYEVPKWKSLEIDDIYDFVMIEAIMKLKGYK